MTQSNATHVPYATAAFHWCLYTLYNWLRSLLDA